MKINFQDKPIEYAILATAVAIAVYVIIKSATTAVGAAANSVAAGVSGVVGAGAGIATGNNVVTAGTPYEGTGIFGTLGASVNDILGGAPATFGSWIGGKLAGDAYDPNTDSGISSSIQSSSNNPFGSGTSAAYADAANAANVPATAVATPFVGTATAGSW